MSTDDDLPKRIAFYALKAISTVKWLPVQYLSAAVATACHEQQIEASEEDKKKAEEIVREALLTLGWEKQR